MLNVRWFFTVLSKSTVFRTWHTSEYSFKVTNETADCTIPLHHLRHFVDGVSVTSVAYHNGRIPTNWKSKLQGIPATSSAQAEFMAMYEAAKDLFFQILLLRELGFKLSRVPLFCDNTTAIRQAMETMSSKSNKHMEIRYAWLQHYAHREGIIQPFNIASSHNLADVLTKILPNKKNFSGTTDVQECSNHYNVMLGHIFSKDIQAFINQRLKEGMVKSDALQTYQAYLEKVESEETQPFRGGGGARLQTRES